MGTSAIEASKIAGHGSVSMTNDYTHVQLKRQDELTRAIQKRLGEAGRKAKEQTADRIAQSRGVPPAASDTKSGIPSILET